VLLAAVAAERSGRPGSLNPLHDAFPGLDAPRCAAAIDAVLGLVTRVLRSRQSTEKPRRGVAVESFGELATGQLSCRGVECQRTFACLKLDPTAALRLVGATTRRMRCTREPRSPDPGCHRQSLLTVLP
jgi:hypothetical protein